MRDTAERCHEATARSRLYMHCSGADEGAQLRRLQGCCPLFRGIGAAALAVDNSTNRQPLYAAFRLPVTGYRLPAFRFPTLLPTQEPVMADSRIQSDDERCIRAVVAALTTDPELIAFMRELAPQWGSSVGKTRSYRGKRLMEGAEGRCILRVDSRAAILLNDKLYSVDGPSATVSLMRDAMLKAEVDEGGRRCLIPAGDDESIQVRIDQYASALGEEVDPASAALDHRVISVSKIG